MARNLIPRIIQYLLSVPIQLKIMGIGAAVAVLFGTVTLYQIQAGMSRTLYQELERTAIYLARSLSSEIERPMVREDFYAVQQGVQRMISHISDVHYIIVYDSKNNIIAQTFPSGVPLELLYVSAKNTPSRGETLVFKNAEGLIFEKTLPILSGNVGKLKIGLSDKRIVSTLSSITKSFLWTLLICMITGQILAVILTYILVRPIDNLVQTARLIHTGNFSSRAKVFSSDEIGTLAAVFNQMTEGLEKYRNEIEEKEAVRLSLLKRIVKVQEDERRYIARELHDQLGQYLSTILLKVQSSKKDNMETKSLADKCESAIHQLIDDVRNLAWRLRPSILDDYGLDSALTRYIGETRELKNIEIDYQYNSLANASRLPNHIETTLYRIAQEAITNILLHAHANWVSVVLSVKVNEVILLIEDDGIGFDAESIWREKDKCIGLVGMRERANLVGGYFLLESIPSKGTSVSVKIPLKENTKL